MTDENQPSDPKLKEAMAEIKAVIEKHDIAAHVALVSETHSEYLIELSPSWTGIALHDGAAVIKINRSGFNTATEYERVIRGTATALYGINQLTANAAQITARIDELFQSKAPVEVGTISHTPHDHDAG